VSKSEQKRICVQSECAVRDELRSLLDAKDKEIAKLKDDLKWYKQGRVMSAED